MKCPGGKATSLNHYCGPKVWGERKVAAGSAWAPQLRAPLCASVRASIYPSPCNVTWYFTPCHIYRRMDFLFFWKQTRNVACAVAMETLREGRQTQFPNGTEWRKAATAKSGPIHLAPTGRLWLFILKVLAQQAERNSPYLEPCLQAIPSLVTPTRLHYTLFCLPPFCPLSPPVSC
jgi:hypothetical protein